MIGAYVIAELGLNAAPFDARKLYHMIRTAKDSRADAVKIQLWDLDNFPSEEREAKAPYEFPRHRLHWFVQEAHIHGLKAGASVFDAEQIAIACKAGCDFLKLATREQDNAWLRFRAVANPKKLPVLRSVAWDGESPFVPQPHYPREVLLACMPQYPAPLPRRGGLANLSTLNPYGRVGYSSHTSVKNSADVIEAVRDGKAVVIEKHLCLDINDPEARWSLLPGEFHYMVQKLREAI